MLASMEVDGCISVDGWMDGWQCIRCAMHTRRHVAALKSVQTRKNLFARDPRATTSFVLKFPGENQLIVRGVQYVDFHEHDTETII
jgi:hypothetical protein